MMSNARRASLPLLVVLAMLVSVLLVLAHSEPADASTPTGKAVGQVIGTEPVKLNVKVRWFANDWTYLGQRRVRGDIYSLALPPGTYHLQFVDLRPAYDVTKYAPSDILVRVRSGRVVQHDVKMRRGAAITGTARAGGKVLRGARIVAANANQQSFETTANKLGQFAIGGLPAGSYSVFTFDRAQIWVGKSLWVAKVRAREARNVLITLRKKGGSLLVDLRQGDGRPMKGEFFVTAVSKKSGQFWTARAKSGEVSFRGLFPGRYKLVAPGAGNYLAQTGAIRGARVRSGRADLASSFTWRTRGAEVMGIVVDYEDPSYPLPGAQVLLYNSQGDRLATTTSDDQGLFRFAGQLSTQTGMTVVAGPDQYSPYLGKGTHYCKYDSGTSDAFEVSNGDTTDVGAVALPHLPADEQDGVLCWPSDGS